MCYIDYVSLFISRLYKEGCNDYLEAVKQNNECAEGIFKDVNHMIYERDYAIIC